MNSFKMTLLVNMNVTSLHKEQIIMCKLTHIIQHFLLQRQSIYHDHLHDFKTVQLF